MNKRSQRWTVVPGLIGCRWIRKEGGGWRTIYKQKMQVKGDA